MDEVWDIFCSNWNETIQNYQIELNAFVLMSNHIHALVTTPNENLDQAMHHLLREVSRDINTRAIRINHVFGGPYKWSVIGNRRYYEHALRYVYQNPVKAGICSKVEEYRFSTIQQIHGNRGNELSLSESFFEKQSVIDLSLSQKLDWLNEIYTKEENECIKRALHYSEFRFRKTHVAYQTRNRLEGSGEVQQELFSV